MSYVSRNSEEDEGKYTVLHKKLEKRKSSINTNIMCWNVWSIMNEKKLENFLQIIQDKNVSIGCITETWFDSLNGTFSQIIKRCGYELHHSFREGKRGGGVAILYKKHLMLKEGGASTSQYSSFEYVFVTLTLQSKKRLLVMCVYRKQEVAFGTFEGEFNLIMDKLVNKGDMLLVMGDFNVWADIEDDGDAQNLSTLMNTYGLNQMIHEPTH